MLRVLLLLATLAVSSCTALDVLKLAKPSSGIDTSVQLGKEANKQVILGDQKKNELDAGDISGDLISTNNDVSTQFTGDLNTGSFTINNMPTRSILTWGAVIIFLLGILFPSPFEVYRWLRGQWLSIKKEKEIF